MGILTWIVLGLIAGSIAKFLSPGRDPGGLMVTIILGILGAVVGGWLGTMLGFGKVQAFDLWGLLTSVLGAMILLFIYRIVRGGRSS